MNKKVLITIGVILFVLLASASVYMIINNNSSSTSSSSNTSTNAEKADLANSGNIFSLTESTKAQQCTFTYSGSNGSGNGKMYTDGKGNGLMTIEVKTEQGNTGTSNTLLLGDKVYGWTNTASQTIGFVYTKEQLTSNTNSGSNSQSSSSSNVDPNQKFNLSCSSWNVDQNILQVPQNVNFTALPGNN